MSGFLDEALRAHADGDLCAEAAAGLLIAGRWPDRDDFAGRFITMTASPGSGTRVAVVDWPAAAGALGAGAFRARPGNDGCCRSPPAWPRGSRSASGTPPPAWTGRNARLVADAVLHASGHRGMP